MNREAITNMGLALKQVQENTKAEVAKKLAKASASSEKGKAAVTLPKAPWDKQKNEAKMDPVDKKELKGKFDDREDKDIDNDGDEDKSDKYLHNRRKTIKKAMGKKDSVEMNPTKKDSKTSADSQMESAELPSVYARILENRALQTKGATPPEGIMDKESPKSKEFAAKHTGEIKDPEPTSVADLNKAARTPSVAAPRNGDNKAGDKSIINKPEDISRSGAK